MFEKLVAHPHAEKVDPESIAKIMEGMMDKYLGILTLVQVILMIFFTVIAVKIAMLFLKVLKEAHAALVAWNKSHQVGD